MKTMDVDTTKPGDKVRFTFPLNGYPADQHLCTINLAPGQILTVKEMKVHSWHTLVLFEEVEGAFNSVNFENIEE